MKRIVSYTILFFTMLLLDCYGQTVIVNSSNSITKISKSALRNIFLGNTSTWENSKQIIITDYFADSPLRKAFSEYYLNLSPKKVSMIWIKASLSGKTVPPKVFHTEDELVKYISENEGAVGYLENAANLSKNIKILQVQ